MQMYPIRQSDDDLLRIIVYAFLFACCLYIFKLRRQRRLEEPSKQRALTSSVPRDRVPAQVKDKPNDLLCQFDCPGGQISSLVLLDGKHVVGICKAERTIRMWEVEENGVVKESPLKADVAASVIASSRDGKRMVTGDKGKVTVWDTSIREPCNTAEQHGKKITALDVSLEHIASGWDDGTVVVWKMGEPLVPVRSMRHGLVPVSSVKFSPSGNRIATACLQHAHEVRIWHTRTGGQMAAIHIGSLASHSLAWSSDGRRLFVGCSNGYIKCFNTITREPPVNVVEPRAGDDSITSLHPSNSGQFLISYSSPGQMIDIWDIRNTPASELIPPYSGCITESISPDDLYLASGRDDRKISIRSLAKVVKSSYFFHRLAPFPTRSEPFTYISPVAYRAWKSGELERAEQVLSEEFDPKRYQEFDCYSRANRALVRIRREDLSGALDDSAQIITNGAQIPLVAHVANAIALGGKGQQREAIAALDSVDHGGAKDFVACVKSIILFESEPRDKLDCLADPSTCPWVKTRKVLLLAEHSMERGDSKETLRLLSNLPDLGPFHHIPEAEIIPLLFGWSIYDLECMVQQLRCQALFASGRTQEVGRFLQANEDRHDEENESRMADLGWLCEKLGDESMCRRRFHDAITWYSKSLELFPESRASYYGSKFAKRCLSAIETVHDAEDETISEDLASMAQYPPGSALLLVKRSRANAYNESWDDALKDADDAIDIDRLCPWAYEGRYVALYTLDRGQEAAETLKEMMKIGGPVGSASYRLCMKYTEIITEIDKQIDAICKISPLILICVKTGVLFNAKERVRVFKEDPIFHGLLSSMSTKLDTNRIEKVVARYFRYVMFSHTWEGQDEPTLQDLAGKSVYDPSPHLLRVKLRRFCETARDDPQGYQWAWSDTCCIDKSKANDTDFKKSIRSMYNWYKASALTIVLLAEGSAALGSNRWMTRAWTLQELLAPKSIRFYNRDWMLYQGDIHPNHKESPVIIEELAEATAISSETIADFSPESLDVRAKLRLASTRKATMEVDIAHALIGIFSSDLTPDSEHPDPKIPLGRLLEEITHRERDVKALLDWVGKSSHFHSCLPDEITVYHRPPYPHPPIPEDEMAARVAELRDSLPRQDITAFFENVSKLGPVQFTHRRLSLPCVIFSVKLTPLKDAFPGSNVYQVQAAALDQVTFKTSCTSFTAQDEVVLVYPWIRDLPTEHSPMEQDNYDRALRLVVHLEQPFRALLLAKKPHDTYQRVAADEEILIPKRELRSLKDIGTKVLQIR